MNDGIVTVTRTDYDIPLPSYANRSNYKCDASGQLAIFNTSLTAKQIYSANQILNTRQGNQKQNVYASTPFTKDIFAYVPIITAGLSAGKSFIDFSDSLQNQERNYFGPVNIKKISIQLLNDLLKKLKNHNFFCYHLFFLHFNSISNDIIWLHL